MSKKSRAEASAMLDPDNDSTSAPAQKAVPRAELLPKPPAPADSPAPAAIVDPTTTPDGDLGTLRYIASYRELPLGYVFPSPLNPRRSLGEGIDDLARSIADKGLLQPILVRPARQLDIEGERWEIIHGARRWTAAMRALDMGLLPGDWRIPARIRDCTDDELVILAGIENFDREDMAPLDEAELFNVVRPRVTPAAGETREAAVARLFHIGERTVFRRLALLRCAPEVQQALRDDKITLGQANALSLGTAEKQLELLPAAVDPDHNYGTKLDPDDIRHEIVETDDDLIDWDHALFDPADYHGKIVEDAESGDKWFADRGEFRRLQELAIRAKTEELEAKWPWVEIERADWLESSRYNYWNAEDNPEAGAVILVAHGGERVEVRAPVLKTKPRSKDIAGDNPDGDDRPTKSATADKANRSPLSPKQIEQLHEAKTQALRRAIAGRATHDGRVPKALACLGLLGARELAMRNSATYSPYGSEFIAPIASAETEQARLAHLLKTVALEVPPKHRHHYEPTVPLGGSYPGEERDAEWFSALMALPADDLDELFARLVAERAGAWTLSSQLPNGGARVGDSPLAAAIAAYAGAESELAALWHPDKDWFLGYGRDRLVAIVRDQLKIRNADKMKKAELAALCVEVPKGFWGPEHFPECRFQTEAEALKALAAPLPPAPETTP